MKIQNFSCRISILLHIRCILHLLEVSLNGILSLMYVRSHVEMETGLAIQRTGQCAG